MFKSMFNISSRLNLEYKVGKLNKLMNFNFKFMRSRPGYFKSPKYDNFVDFVDD
jgi:hypothetical protein